MKDTQTNKLRLGRLSRRIIQHHLPLLAVLAFSTFFFYRSLPQKDVIWKLSFVTAYSALLLLVATLLIGPWKLLRGRRPAVSSDLRRDIGIWAGILGIIHTGVGLFVHLRGRPWLYFVYGKTERHHIVPLRHDLFGFSNDSGLIGTVILVLLLATSNDYSLRRFGRAKWKQLQRWNYLLFAAVALHSFGYQTIEKQRAPFVAVVIACVVITLLLQIYGFRVNRAAIARQRLSKV
ncbi:MAG TPA: hypothetical protein VFN53_08795 [Acidobacteriaceae bacterium]|nr:hypothetical protein [Acidobacteriaceae bacterium]